MLPFTGLLAALVAGGRTAGRIALALLPAGLAIATAIVLKLLQTGEALTYLLGGWSPPLGVTLRIDGLAAAMLLTTAIIVCAIGLFARADFATPPGTTEARGPFAFWMLLLAVWGALNTVFMAGDLFTLFVALELLTFSAVPLVSLGGSAETLQAALRYLLFALAGSLLYLAGVTLLYGAYGTLDIGLLAQRVQPEPVTWVAAALMTAGLAAKTALFPLHLWLPPAHAGAPAAASALLSALVIKGSFFVVVRLWYDVLPGVVNGAAPQILAALGAGAILVGNVAALRQVRLKLMVAYSTVAQIGYLFLMFPLALGSGATLATSTTALAGGMMQAIAHAFAKAAMFMAAGLVYTGLGHDRVGGLAGAARALPMTVLAFALAGVSLIGLPPSGGFMAKWLLLSAAVETGHWVWAAVMLVGGLLTTGYVLLVLVRALAVPPAPLVLCAPIPCQRQAVPLALALIAALLGLVAFAGQDLLGVGRSPGGIP
jgi:formate hydrogenlyase subunit 3/multisubunit Na+/H+ antiporter MnhD subunit